MASVLTRRRSRPFVRHDPKQLRQWLGLATYLHHYSKNFAATVRPLSQLVKADATWAWRPEHQATFDVVKRGLSTAPVLMLPDHSKPFHVVCDASDLAIGCALMQFDDEGRERVVRYQSRQLKPAERNYAVHDKELLAMRYALIKFRVYLLGVLESLWHHEPLPQHGTFAARLRALGLLLGSSRLGVRFRAARCPDMGYAEVDVETVKKSAGAARGSNGNEPPRCGTTASRWLSTWRVKSVGLSSLALIGR
ncbi:hypothetical protein PC116_g25396 [Phytophthora cactorum]|uniref:Reverse transcriptase/retrotransposon-derived protein RNase H-like domain-containing protein n=2 Tax=Phytophthora cactorum TaxID=29920 RepID=A0A8T1F0R9_9STRA|nr:hypothetical protein PC113_g21180 [Phytophthora cactorum]KAG2895211.1 hypothetical protein PC117_g23302 [Phytophthora cactorum]KAG2958780.1 hypothetical protein PC118_g23351 [Phytophthora cactorum]KAG2962798.1 hypothetical protein PC119_g25701 [Phytophthora cactorum]KAG2976314.1 hypothetical protein PC120_g25711 [Phytophthora cactorum]